MRKRFLALGGWPWFIALVALVVLAIAPTIVDRYWIRVLTSTFMFAALASSWNIIAGFCGYPAFGNVVFFGIGAYTSGLLMLATDMSHVITLLPAGLLCAAVALVCGLPILRLRGHYFAIATLALNELVRELVTNSPGLTGGGKGLTVPITKGSITFIYNYYYFLMLTLLVAVVVFTAFTVRGALGYAWAAMHDNEEGAAVLGVNGPRFKAIAWASSAFFTGIAGAIYASWMTYIEPNNVFDLLMAVKFIIMVLLGGGGTIFGPVVGAFILETISEVLWTEFLNAHLAIMGAIMMLVVIFIPRGFAALVRGSWNPRVLLANIVENRVR